MMQPVSTDPDSVAFVVQSFLAGAIDAEDLRIWAEHALVQGEDCPMFVEGLAEFDGVGEEILRVLGFTPARPFSAEELAALAGIAHRRRSGDDGDAPDATEALAALERQPAVLEEFRRVFAFLSLRGEGPAGLP